MGEGRGRQSRAPRHVIDVGEPIENDTSERMTWEKSRDRSLMGGRGIVPEASDDPEEPNKVWETLTDTRFTTPRTASGRIEKIFTEPTEKREEEPQEYKDNNLSRIRKNRKDIEDMRSRKSQDAKKRSEKEKKEAERARQKKKEDDDIAAARRRAEQAASRPPSPPPNAGGTYESVRPTPNVRVAPATRPSATQHNAPPPAFVRREEIRPQQSHPTEPKQVQKKSGLLEALRRFFREE